MSDSAERLYQLLPAVYRQRDVEQGLPLRALLAVLDTERQVLEDDIARLYDNWFIETCDEWVVPYIGDLLGVRGLLPVTNGAFSERSFVANTLTYRRGKGTSAVVEQLAHDLTAWPAKAIEFFRLLCTTQSVNHVRRDNLSFASLRSADRLQLVNGPLESAAHTADVRHIDRHRGRYNIPNIGVFLWRLQDYPLVRTTARPLAALDGRYHFNPLGLDVALFNRPKTKGATGESTQEKHLPVPLRLLPLYQELEDRRQALVSGLTPAPVYFGDTPVFQVFVQSVAKGPFEAISPENILIANLSDYPPSPPPPNDWPRPNATKDYSPKPNGPVDPWPIRLAVDPVLGRLAFPAGVKPAGVEVSYAYGFSGDLGGGPYPRPDAASQWYNSDDKTLPKWRIAVTKTAPAGSQDQVATLTEAIQGWTALKPGSLGVITILDSRSYVEDLTGLNSIKIPTGSKLAIVAKPGERPHLQGSLSVKGTAGVKASDLGELVVEGLLVEGPATVLVGNLGSLRIVHSTLAPGTSGLTVNPSANDGQQNAGLTVTLARSISGPLALAGTERCLSIQDSIVQAKGVAISAPATEVAGSTIFGVTNVQTLQASNSIFSAKVSALRRQLGCVRYCYLPLGSLAPRRFHCQPTAGAGGTYLQFTSDVYGQPGYAQLSPRCSDKIRSGADDQGEMGAFHFLQQTQRLKNLQATLGQFLRLGLEVGIFQAT